MFDVEETLKFLLNGAENINDVKALKEKLNEVYKEGRGLRIKFGMDPSAPDIHLGHEKKKKKMKQLQDLGNEVTIIIGDFTGMIGDPTGKSKTRKQLTKEQVEENALTYQKQIFKILDPEKTTVRYNSEWLGKMNFRDVIELCSKCTVARILERDDFQKRYTNNQPIAVHEFFYPLMQAYDSVAIKADLEMGGTDQTFNVLMGRNIQKDYGQDSQITLFMPLLEGIDGVEKMSKSLGNYIGINEDANTMFEKVMKIPDNMIIKYYNLCTDIHPDDVAKVEARLNKGENPRDIKMELASEITRLYHSEEETKQAKEHFTMAFQKQEAPEDIEEIKFDNNILDTLLKTKKCTSKAELKRLFEQGGIKVEGEKVVDYQKLNNIDKDIIIQMGKGSFFKIIR